jgi:hypothetical protein
MTEILYRHSLGEPLALDVPPWWKTCKAKYVIVGDFSPGPAEIRVTPPPTPLPTVPVRKPRRAVAF